MIPYPRLPGLSASCFAVRQHRNRWLTRSHQLGRRLRPTLRQSHTLPLLTPAPAASSFCSRQPTHTAPLSASITGQRRYACSWPLAVLVNSLSNDSVSRIQIDDNICIRRVVINGSSPMLHLSGGEWQSYFIFGSGWFCSVNAAGQGEPVLNKISVTEATASRGASSGEIDLKLASSNVIAMVISYSTFTATAV